jgi:hypothetical protein
VDDNGGLVADSFSYSPLIDFARYIEHNRNQAISMQKLVAKALTWIETREADLEEIWQSISSSGVFGYQAVDQVVSKVRVKGDRSRFVTQWIWPDAQPQGQLPAFFREDLLAAASGSTSALLGDFMSGRPGGRPKSIQDVEHRQGLEPLLNSGLVPRAAWPSGYRLRLSQQVALTAILEGNADRLTAVNGPPGTGKTTLMRDLYANLLTRRASIMAEYVTPTSAFGPKQELPSMNAQHWQLYAPVEQLCGFEILVASSNNSAVENITKELPASSKLSAEFSDSLRYFREDANVWPVGASPPKKMRRTRTDSDNKKPDDEVRYRPGLLPDGRAWGFVAAALGSRDRVDTFQEVVGRYLGDRSEIPHLLRSLRKPPGPNEWTAARQRFQAAERAVEDQITGLRRVPQARIDLGHAEREFAHRAAALADARQKSAVATFEVGEAKRAVPYHRSRSEAALSDVQQHSKNRPGWWSQWRDAKGAAIWQQEFERLTKRAAQATDWSKAWQAELTKRISAQMAADAKVRQAQQAAATAKTKVEEIQRELNSYVAWSSTEQVTEEWWARRTTDDGREAVELGTAWISPVLQRLREELFAAAIGVHETFARCCRVQMRANLRTWMALQTNEIQPQAAEKATLPAWQGFFLLIPLVSTTFASMARLMRRVPVSSLGWLIVDEAGQSVPAAAVGGLARFQHGVIVGDPLQLEPVVTLPRALVDQLMAHHRAPADLAPTRSSVQTLADAVSRRGTQRGDRWVSLPLLVHNRCLDPMFSIANQMAYLGKMVQGRQAQTADSASTPIPTGWIDVPRGQGESDHFLDRDWQQVRSLLQRLDWTTSPSLAVISPFKRVTRRLTPLIYEQVRSLMPENQRSDDDLKRAMGSAKAGTVHTFQGREHDTVILVLGGGTSGARQWAASTPNLLNVAITRARDRLYVVGDRAAWETVGMAQYLAVLPAFDLEPDDLLPRFQQRATT